MVSLHSRFSFSLLEMDKNIRGPEIFLGIMAESVDLDTYREGAGIDKEEPKLLSFRNGGSGEPTSSHRDLRRRLGKRDEVSPLECAEHQRRKREMKNVPRRTEKQGCYLPLGGWHNRRYIGSD